MQAYTTKVKVSQHAVYYAHLTRKRLGSVIKCKQFDFKAHSQPLSQSIMKLINYGNEFFIVLQMSFHLY